MTLSGEVFGCTYDTKRIKENGYSKHCQVKKFHSPTEGPATRNQEGRLSQRWDVIAQESVSEQCEQSETDEELSLTQQAFRPRPLGEPNPRNNPLTSALESLHLQLIHHHAQQCRGSSSHRLETGKSNEMRCVDFASEDLMAARNGQQASHCRVPTGQLSSFLLFCVTITMPS